MQKYENKKIILHEMKKIFYPKGVEYIDWMGYRITDDNKPSYHHIDKACDLEDSEPTIENGAYLGKRSHEVLHMLELTDKELYLAWNQLFRVINDSRDYPNIETWNVINELKENTETVKNSKNKRKK